MKNILKYTIPTMLSLLLSGLYTIIDGLFIGQHSGDIGLTAINIAWPIPALFIATGLGIGVGGSILYSQKVGTQQYRQAYYTLLITFGLLLLVSIFFMVIFYFTFPRILTLLQASGEVYNQAYQYLQIVILGCFFQIFALGTIPLLRNLNYPIHAMVISMVGVISNLLLNYQFIIVNDQGIAGAAMGTLLSQVLVSILIISLLYLHRSKITSLKDKSHERAKKHLLREIFVRGIVPFGVSLTPSLVLIFTNIMCLQHGSTQAVGAYTVISYITFPVTSMLLGIGDGLQPLMSIQYGQNNQQELHKIIKIGYRIGIILSIILMFGLFFSTDTLSMVFGLSDIAREYFSQGFLISLLAFPFIFLFKFKASIMNATGQSIRASKLTYVEGIIIAPLLIFGLAALFALTGVWLSYLFTSIIMCVIAYTIL